LVALDEQLRLDDCVIADRQPRLRAALERQRPLWEPGTMQGYHAITFGMYAREVFERIAKESMGTFLQRELHGVARAYLPFAGGGRCEGRVFLKAQTIEPVLRRQGWSKRDAVLQKPLGWSQGFLKEETGLFSPNEESFGHAGMGGALGWCDPVNDLTFGYVMNRLDAAVRSPRALALCRALYACDSLRAT
jgi:CubicO group peptidase (beta-lactamase class C family)